MLMFRTTTILVLSQVSVLKPVSRVIVAGGAGTWFTFGYLIYVIVGVIIADFACSNLANRLTKGVIG
jgi:hypothetical protein